MMNLDVRTMKFAQHVSDLARAFEIQLHVDPRMNPDEAGAGTTGTGQRFIRVAPVIDETTYCVALHELGHCVAPSGALITEKSDAMQNHGVIATKRDMILTLEEERAAWQWAKHYALEWTPAMDAVRRMAFRSYRQLARQLGVNA
jgi:hypothetical protein